MGSVNNGISIWLKDEFLYENAEYTLELDENISSKYGVKIGSGVSKEFLGNGEENNKLDVASMRVLNDKYIRIIFSEDVSSSALDNSNYSLLNKTKDINYTSAFGAVFTGTDELKYRQVDIKFLNIDPEEEFELTIKDIEDKFKERTLNEIVIPFSEYVEVDELAIDAVVAKDQGTVLLYFNKPVASDNTFNNILISNPSRSIDSKFLDNENPFLVTLILDENKQLVSGEDYDFKILTGAVSDLNGETNNETLETVLSGTSTPYPETRFSEAYFVSEDSIYLKFNLDVDQSNSKTKFRLKYKDNDGDDQYINVSSISFKNTKEAIVKFNDLSSTEDYKIYGNNIDDYSGQYQSSEFYKSVRR